MSFIPPSCTHRNPTLVYVPSLHSPGPAKNRSLFSLREAINMKILKAVSENPNPGMSGSE